MDAVFGRENFRNEIAWCYRGGGVPRKDFARKHDVILRYSKGDSYLCSTHSSPTTQTRPRSLVRSRGGVSIDDKSARFGTRSPHARLVVGHQLAANVVSRAHRLSDSETSSKLLERIINCVEQSLGTQCWIRSADAARR